MNRKQIRYLCARMRTEAEGGAIRPDEMPDGFIKTFESQSGFRGWSSFGVTWDVSKNDPWTIISLEKSLAEEWNDTLAKVVPELPHQKEPHKRKKSKWLTRG